VINYLRRNIKDKTLRLLPGSDLVGFGAFRKRFKE
jgi:hypothetical protein